MELKNKISNTLKLLKEKKFYNGRMISASKSFYRREYPYNDVLFNANIFINIDGKSIKIWYGDLDITLDGEELKKIAKKINTTLYIVSEFNGRFENEEITKDINEVSHWDTTQDILEITKEYIKEQEIENAKMKKQYAIEHIENEKRKKEENSKYPIVDIMKDDKFDYKEVINLPIDLLNEELKIFKEKFYSYKNKPNRKKGKLHTEYFKDYGYFTYGVLDKYLSDKYNVPENHIIIPSSIWMSIDTNEILRKIDLEIEQMYNKNFKEKDFERYVTCNYCIEDYYYLNSKEINQYSYKDNKLYIRNGDFSRKK